jgi:DNA-binding transcriptional LysR family regulator
LRFPCPIAQIWRAPPNAVFEFENVIGTTRRQIVLTVDFNTFYVSKMDFRLIRHLSYFLVVAEEKHFGRAAQRLGISQPPLSAQIQILEQSLGTALFERSRAGVKLTREGEAILPAVQRFMDQAQRLDSVVREAKEGRQQTIVVAAIVTAMFHPLGPAIRLLRERTQGIQISITEMDSADALIALERREVDLAFVRADMVADPLVAVPLARETLALAIPAGHRLASQETISLANLATERMIVTPRRISPLYADSIVAACREAGFSPRVTHEAKSVMSQLAFVTCGVGVALIPETMSNLGASGVVFRPLDRPLSVVTIAAVWNSENHHPLTEMFVEAAREAM